MLEENHLESLTCLDRCSIVHARLRKIPCSSLGYLPSRPRIHQYVSATFQMICQTYEDLRCSHHTDRAITTSAKRVALLLQVPVSAARSFFFQPPAL